MQVLRTDYTGRGKWRKVATALNAIGLAINDMFGENGIEIEHRGGRIVVSVEAVRSGGGASFPWHLVSFGYRLVYDDTEGSEGWNVGIYGGSVRVHGFGSYSLSPFPIDGERGYELVSIEGMASPWVYVEVARGAISGTELTVAASSSEPVTTATTLRIPLYVFKQSGGGYALSQVCNIGDVNFDLPLL